MAQSREEKESPSLPLVFLPDDILSLAAFFFFILLTTMTRLASNALSWPLSLPLPTSLSLHSSFSLETRSLFLYHSSSMVAMMRSGLQGELKRHRETPPFAMEETLSFGWGNVAVCSGGSPWRPTAVRELEHRSMTIFVGYISSVPSCSAQLDLQDGTLRLRQKWLDRWYIFVCKIAKLCQ